MLFALLAGCASSTGDQVAVVDAGEDEQLTASTTESPNDVICRRQRVTGSHRMEKVCRTRAEIEQTTDETQRSIRNAGTRSDITSNSN
jgi:hypothetical protein